MAVNEAVRYPSTGNLCSLFGGSSLPYAVTVSGAGRIFFEAVERLQFLTRLELLFFKTCSFPAVRFVMSTLIKKRTFNHCGRSEALEQYTSWKVRVPQLEKCCVSIYLFSFSVSVSVCCVWVVVVVVCVSVFLVVFGASAMKVNAWTCAPATASDLESALRSISVRTRPMENYA